MGALVEWLSQYGGWGFSIALGGLVLWLVLNGKLVTVVQLQRERANDKETIRTLKEANASYAASLPKILSSLEVQEHALKSIQEAGKKAGGPQ